MEIGDKNEQNNKEFIIKNIEKIDVEEESSETPTLGILEEKLIIDKMRFCSRNIANCQHLKITKLQPNPGKTEVAWGIVSLELVLMVDGKSDGANWVLSIEDFEHIVARMRELVDNEIWVDIEDGYIRASGETIKRPHALNLDHVLKAIKGLVNKNSSNRYREANPHWNLPILSKKENDTSKEENLKKKDATNNTHDNDQNQLSIKDQKMEEPAPKEENIIKKEDLKKEYLIKKENSEKEDATKRADQIRNKENKDD